MDVTQHVVDRIVAHCKQNGFIISNAIASFFAKTTVLANRTLFKIGEEITPGLIEELVSVS